MQNCRIILVLAALAVMSAGGIALADASAPAAEVLDDRPAAVPIVPLPPAAYGSIASVGLMIALRYSRHRRWLTLR